MSQNSSFNLCLGREVCVFLYVHLDEILDGDNNCISWKMYCKTLQFDILPSLMLFSIVSVNAALSTSPM